MSYRVQARNISHASENRIHDDDVAKRFGFQGGLVPGVEVYAYMTHLPVARWGIDWLERGSAECRFLAPVYDGRFVSVSATEDVSGLAISVESEGKHCASGSASLPGELAAAPAIPDGATIPAFDERPDANEETLAVGRRLSSRPLEVTHDYLSEYLEVIHETEPLYRRENLVHPALMLRVSNSALKDNVRLDAWIHTGSAIRHCGLARAGEALVAHATVAANYERKGHRFVELDVVMVADARAVAQIRHTAIYRLRRETA